MFNMKKFADLLSVKRKAKGLTQDQLADLVGVSHQAVSKWERAEALPEISKIGDIALAIETPTEDLINALYEVDPILAEKCAPECIYRGFCPETERCCGWVNSESYKKRLEEYRKIK